MSKTTLTQTWSLASFALEDPYTDFILSPQAMSCTPDDGGPFLAPSAPQGEGKRWEALARLVCTPRYLPVVINVVQAGCRSLSLGVIAGVQ
jgi:hypothetical protein